MVFNGAKNFGKSILVLLIVFLKYLILRKKKILAEINHQNNHNNTMKKNGKIGISHKTLINIKEL